MTNIKEALDQLFTYERTATPIQAYMVEQGYKDQGDNLNRRVEDKDCGFYGIIPLKGQIFRDRGVTAAIYTGEKKLTMDGDILPPPFDNFKNCSYVHHGVLLNCLAYMSRDVHDIVCVHNWDNSISRFQMKREIAEKFLSHLSPIKTYEAVKKRGGKKALTDPNQNKLF